MTSPSARQPRRSQPAEPAASLSGQAYDTLRARILKGEIPLGSIVSRRRIAAELGMSHLPVAEAMQRLENDEILESRPRVGTVVRIPTPAEIRDRYEIREALEAHAARLFARFAGPRDKAALHEMAEQVDSLFNRCFSGGSNDPEYLYTVQSFHARFHLRIAERCGCASLRTALEKNQVLTFNWLHDVAAQRPPLPAAFHRDLAASLTAGGEEEADRAMRLHVRHGREYVVSRIAQLQPAPGKLSAISTSRSART